jgi:tripartite ATP-independent transporter DctP family solute receptor
LFKKTLGVVIALILMVCMVAGCSQSSKKADSTNGDNKKPIVMKVGHAHNIDTPRHQSYLKFKELVEQKTNNGIKVEIYPSGQVGDEVAMIEATKIGTLQGTRGGPFEKMAPEFMVYTLPFLFDNLDGIEKVTMGPIGDRIAKASEKNGLVTLTTGDGGGFRNISNNKRPIVTPDDMKGLKIRTPGIESIIKTMEVFGANPVSIPFGDVYMALKTNVADGQENPPVNMESMKITEVQKYLSVIEYQFHPDPFVVNLKWYQSLSPEYQKILKECAVEAMKYNDQLIKEANQKAMDNMKKSMEVMVLTPEQRNAFRATVKPVWDYYINKGICTQKDIDEIRSLAK